MSDAPYVPLRPIMLKQRAGIIFLRYGELDVIDSAFVAHDWPLQRYSLAPLLAQLRADPRVAALLAKTRTMTDTPEHPE